MRKLLLLFVCVLASVGAWATTVVTSDGEMTITSTEKGSLRNYSFTAADKAATSVVLIGEFEQADLDAIKTNGNDFKFTSVDFSQAEFPKPANYKLYNTALPDLVYDEDKYVLGATVYQYTNGAWTQVTSYNDGQEAKYYLADESEEKPSANNNEYLAVGGTVNKMVHDWGTNTHTWVDAPAKENDWKAIKFNKWASSIETAILPDGILADDLDQNELWQNCSNLTRVESGATYAVITKVNNQNTAEVFAASDEEFNRMKAILMRGNLVSENNIERGSTSNDYIHYDAQTGIAEVHVTEPGSFTRLFPKNTYADGTIFRFDSDCANFSADELKMMATDPSKYYVDLYDVTTSTDVESAIRGAIGSMRTSNTQYKGLLLPKNPTSVGTTLIQDEQQGPGAKATCSEFIAYNNQTVTMAHIYADNPVNPGNNNTYENRLAKLKTIMDAHVDDEGNKVIEKATTVYAVSTNKPTEITNVVNIIKGDEDATVIHTYNNEMVSSATEPSMDVFPTEAGHFADAVEATSIENTVNLDDLKFSGDVDVDDILALNEFVSGPKVLDLSQVPFEHISRDLLKDLDNDFIEYIILPAGLDEPVVADYPNLASLKCVISSNKGTDQEHVLNAYVKEAGSLAKARCLATGNSVTNAGEYKPTAQQLTSVKLVGNLNANDIGTGDGNGLQRENGSVTSIDLEKAYFAEVNDMKLGSGGAGLMKLTEVKLPATPDDPDAPLMTEIPANCLYGIASLHNLHIPYNYKKIGYAAFRETTIDHITTEDASHVLIDNGPNSYTFSANIEEIGEAGHQEGEATFPQTVRIKDVYCLSAKAPKCYQATFPAQILAGNGGANEGIYCQDKYQGLGENEKCFALLHFPSLESYKNAGVKDKSYDEMVAHYTDPTRAYTKKDQTGAVDANGNPLVWPDQGELYLTYGMAASGNIWKDYPNPSYEGEDYHLTNFGTANGGPHDVTNENDPYSFRPDYTGWHEFVLSMASYVDPDEIVDEEDVVRYYEEAGWYTFCIPFDMTVSQVQEMLGVPASDPANHIISKFIEDDGTQTVVDGTTVPAKMPEIRQLTKVTRLKGSGSQSNQVRFILTRDLYNNGDPLCLNFDHTQEEAADVITRPSAGGDASDPICLVGGHPYLIKAYKRVNPGTRIDEYKISGQNLGKYILTRYTDNFKKEASCVNRSECMEQLGDNHLSTLQFARPFEEHKVQAMKDAEEAEYLYYNDGKGEKKKYHYTMAGQFWTQDLPKYCVYMSKGSWYRYTANKGYTWDPYKCIIMATPEIEKADVQAPDPETEGYQNVVTEPTVLASMHMGGKFRNFVTSKFPVVQAGTIDRLNNSFELRFVDGRDDDDFNQAAGSKFTFAFEDGITEFDDNGTEVTAIKNLDGEDIETMFATGKVYNMSGQYVGTSLDGLNKGMYIMNGKKYVVK